MKISVMNYNGNSIPVALNRVSITMIELFKNISHQKYRDLHNYNRRGWGEYTKHEYEYEYLTWHEYEYEYCNNGRVFEYEYEYFISKESYESQHYLSKPYTVECRYNAVWYCKILHDQLQEMRQNVNQTLDPQKTPHTSP